MDSAARSTVHDFFSKRPVPSTGRFRIEGAGAAGEAGVVADLDRGGCVERRVPGIHAGADAGD